jgi:hypothetical protein
MIAAPLPTTAREAFVAISSSTPYPAAATPITTNSTVARANAGW